MNHIFEGSSNSKISSGICLSTIAINYPIFFYDSFLNINEIDSDEEPNKLNYARAFSNLLTIINEELILNVIEALELIGMEFFKNDQVHEFREGMDWYFFDEKFEILMSCSNEIIENNSEFFYFKFIKGEIPF